jgi:hypothetical protein
MKFSESAELLASCLSYSSVLKMEEISSYAISINFQWTIRRRNPEDRTFHNHSFAWLNLRLHLIRVIRGETRVSSDEHISLLEFFR